MHTCGLPTAHILMQRQLTIHTPNELCRHPACMSRTQTNSKCLGLFGPAQDRLASGCTGVLLYVSLGKAPRATGASVGPCAAVVGQRRGGLASATSAPKLLCGGEEIRCVNSYDSVPDLRMFGYRYNKVVENQVYKLQSTVAPHVRSRK